MRVKHSRKSFDSTSKRHGLFHTLAGMISTLFGGILIKIVLEKPPETFTMLIFVFTLFLMWGPVFYYFHSNN